MSRFLSTFASAPRIVRLLTNHGSDALKFTVEKGRYVKPLVPKRIAADYRKKTIIEGTFGTFVPNEGGWDPTWDMPTKIYPLRPHKGHKNERNRQERYRISTNHIKPPFLFMLFMLTILPQQIRQNSVCNEGDA